MINEIRTFTAHIFSIIGTLLIADIIDMIIYKIFLSYITIQPTPKRVLIYVHSI